MSQLFTMAPSTFCLAVAQTGGKELVREAPTSPIPEWQDGSFCFPICYYVCSLIEAGKTTAPAGGTIKTYLCYLSELIRYCDDKLDRDFLQLTDWSFSDTVGRLYPSNNFDKPRENQSNRNRTTVHKMVCQWLDFLAFYATLRGRDDFLGEHGVIKAVRVEKTVKKNGKTFRTWVWEHNALAPVDAYRYLAPMSEKHLAQLRRAVRLLESSAFTKRKRLTMLELFSTVGLRRIEASLLRVSDVRPAIDDLNRYLQSASKFADKFAQKVDDMTASARAVFTLKFRMRKQKKGRERIRTTPISAVTLQFFKEYLEARAIEVRKAGYVDDDDSPFFINLQKREPYRPNYFTQEFSALAIAAGLGQVPCSPHRMRARFIVNELIRLGRDAIERAGSAAKGFVIDLRDLIGKLMEITGHLSPEAIDVYIGYAKGELFGFGQCDSRSEMERRLAAINHAEEVYRIQITAGVEPAVAGEELARAIKVAAATS